MISLSDRQLSIVAEVAKPLPIEKRAQFLERIAAMLELRRRGRRFTDDDVIDCTALAKRGLVQHSNDAA